MSRIAPTSRGSTAYSRRRAVTACQVCRARRTKCDQKKPRCSFCEKTNAECVSDPAALSAFDPASLAILERLDVVEKKLDSLQHGHQSSSQTGVAVAATPSAGPTSHSPIGLAPSAPRHSIPENLLPENLDSVLKWPVFQDFIRPIRDSPRFSTPATAAHPAAQHQPPLLGDELDPSTTKEYLDTFFTHVHTKNPVLDETYTRRLVRKVSLEGPGWDAESCLALLVCANGAITRAFSAPSLPNEEIRSSPGHSLFNAAQKRMGAVLNTAGVVQAQCFFFVGVYLMTVCRPFDAWRSFLQGLAICQTFNFNSSGGRNEGSTPAEESIYWSCWKSENELRLELDLPDFGNRSSLQPPQRFPSLPQTDEGQMLRAWYFYLSEISLWRLEAEATKDITSCLSHSPQSDSEDLLDRLAAISESYDQQLTAWQESLPPTVSISDHPGIAEDETDVLRFVLRGRTTYVKELITWAFIAYALNGQRMSSTATRWVAKGLDVHMQRLVINRYGFYHRHHGTWLMMRTSARSALVLLAVARSAAGDLLPHGWREAVEATMEMLYYWRGEMEGVEEMGILFQSLMSQHQ